MLLEAPSIIFDLGGEVHLEGILAKIGEDETNEVLSYNLEGPYCLECENSLKTSEVVNEAMETIDEMKKNSEKVWICESCKNNGDNPLYIPIFCFDSENEEKMEFEMVSIDELKDFVKNAIQNLDTNLRDNLTEICFSDPICECCMETM